MLIRFPWLESGRIFAEYFMILIRVTARHGGNETLFAMIPIRNNILSSLHINNRPHRINACYRESVFPLTHRSPPPHKILHRSHHLAAERAVNVMAERRALIIDGQFLFNRSCTVGAFEQRKEKKVNWMVHWLILKFFSRVSFFSECICR